MIEIKESFWVPSVAGGPYAGGQHVELGAELEEQLCPGGVESDKARVVE
jgi:hypothetical protein